MMSQEKDIPDFQIPYPDKYAPQKSPEHTITWTRKQDGSFEKKERDEKDEGKKSA